MQLSKHFPVRMYSYSLGGTKVATTEGQWLLIKWLECTAAKHPDNSLKLVCASPYILPTLYVSIMTVTSLNYVMIVCFPLSVGKTLCMHSRVMPTCLCICWHPCQPILTFLILTHELAHQFHIPISKSVTYIYCHNYIMIMWLNCGNYITLHYGKYLCYCNVM